MVGVKIEVETGLDLSAVTEAKLLVKKPGGVVEEWAASIDGTKLVYVTKEGDLDIAGRYEIQALIKTPATEFKGEIAPVVVYPAIK